MKRYFTSKWIAQGLHGDFETALQLPRTRMHKWQAEKNSQLMTLKDERDAARADGLRLAQQWIPVVVHAA